MAQVARVEDPADRPVDDFDAFCADVLGSLLRADQRRVGKAYLSGLLNCPGRKSIRQIAAMVRCGQSEQSLQQFINQSPWDYEPIRRRLLHHLMEIGRPTAWVVDEVAFPKHGRYSAGVERQYVRSTQRVSNCQLAIVATMVCDGFTVPVNWRLLVPESWRQDEERRARARMPDEEHPRPYWRYQMEVLDDVVLDWGTSDAPVVVDARPLATAEALFTALEGRDMPYIAQVNPNLTVGYAVNRRNAPVDGSRVRGGYRRGPLTDLVPYTSDVRRVTAGWSEGAGDRVRRGQFLQLPIWPTDQGGTVSRLRPVERKLIAEWPLARPRPREYWITNITTGALPELVALAKLPGQVGPRLEDFATRFGLRDYEGRTFAGWHHHVTLATAAHVFRVLTAPGRAAGPGPDDWHAPTFARQWQATPVKKAPAWR